MPIIGIISTFTDEFYAWGGSEYLWAVVAAEALSEGHEVLVSISECSADHPKVVKLSQQGARLFVRPPAHTAIAKLNSKLRRIFGSKFSALSLYKPLLDKKPDIIYISQSSSYDIIAIPDLLQLLKNAEIRYIPICQFNADGWFLSSTNQSIIKDFFNNADRVAFVSHNNLKTCERHLARFLPNAVVIQNPVNLSDLSLVPWLDQDLPICFASVARLEVAFKGQDILFDVLSKPQWQQRNWQLNLYGSGLDLNYLQELARHYQIADRIKIVGHINDIRAIWAENHMLVMPSRAEGTPLALVEAMLCGRPAMVTDVGDNAAWIKEAQTGFIAAAATIGSVGAALDRAWLVRDDWQQLGINAHKDALAKHDLAPGKTMLKMLTDRKKIQNY